MLKRWIINKGIVKLFYPLIHIKQLIINIEYRELYKLIFKYGGLDRFYEHEIVFRNYKFSVPDVASFLSTYEELFYKKYICL